MHNINHNMNPISPNRLVAARVETREKLPASNPALQSSNAADFRQIMESAAMQRKLEFSKHANMRLVSRNIEFTSEQMQRIEDGVARAHHKGIRDSLVLIDNIALVINIANKVVVTALNRQDQDQIFTNIDGAVIV